MSPKSAAQNSTKVAVHHGTIVSKLRPSDAFINIIADIAPSLQADPALKKYLPFHISCQSLNVWGFLETVCITMITPPMTPEAQERCCQAFEDAINTKTSYRQPHVISIPVHIVHEAPLVPWCVPDILDDTNVSINTCANLQDTKKMTITPYRPNPKTNVQCFPTFIVHFTMH